MVKEILKKKKKKNIQEDFTYHKSQAKKSAVLETYCINRLGEFYGNKSKQG